jgi:late embryogenesis abundant protein
LAVVDRTNYDLAVHRLHALGQRVRLRSRAAVALGAAGLAACATLGAIVPLRFQEASGRDSEIRLLGPSGSRPLGGAALRLWLEVENPNAIGVTLTEIEGDLLISDAEAIAVDFPLGLPLVALQDTVIPLDVSIGFDDLPRLAGVARDALAGRPLPYRLDGRFGVAAGALGDVRFGPLTIVRGEFRVR